MPKVNEEYFTEIKNKILQAAFEVCKRKPAYEVTMSDIVAETGMSQGGVYKYFNNIDSLLAALIDKANSVGNYKTEIDTVMASGKSSVKKLQELFDLSERYFSDMLISYNKILFELSSLFAYNPEKQKAIYKQVNTFSTFEYLTKCAAETIIKGVQKGDFKPLVPVEDVMSFLVASFDGIIRDVTLTKCYGKKGQKNAFQFDEKKLIQSLYLSTMALLGKPRKPKGENQK